MAFAYEVYCYYNVEMLEAVFNGVAMILNGGAYATLVKSVLTLGVIIMAMVSLGTGRFEGMKWLVISIVFYVGFLGPKTNVMLVDRLATQPPRVVANVPVGLAFMAHFTSSIGDWMTTTMETAFTVLPNSLKFGANPSTASPGETRGILFGARLLDETRRAVIASPTLRQDWYAFIRNCTIYDVAAGRIDPDALQTSTDVIGMLGNTSVSRMTTQTEAGQPMQESCNLVYPNLVRRLNLDAIKEANAIGRRLNPNFKSTDPNAAVLAAYNTQSSETTQLMLGVSKNAQEMIGQAMAINLMDGAGAVIGQQLQDQAAVSLAIAQAQAEATANSSYATMAKVAESAMPKIRNVIEVVLYATFPIIMLIVLIAGHKAGAPLKAYFMTMVWLQLWPPLYAILNLVTTMETAKQTAAAAAAAGGGLTIASASDIGSVSLSSQAIAGYMVMLIPVIAGAITKGGEQAMTSLASLLTAPSQQAASKAGDQVATGNLSYGNTSLDNHSAHNTNMWKHDTNFAHKSGMSTVQTPSGGSISTGQDGTVWGSEAKNDLLVRGGIANQVKQSHEAAHESAARVLQSERATLTDATSAVLGRSSMFTMDAKNGVQLNNEARKGMTTEAVEAYSKTATLANTLRERAGVSQEEAVSLSGAVAAGASLGDASKALLGKVGGKASKALRELADDVDTGARMGGSIQGRKSLAQEIDQSSVAQEARESGQRLATSLSKGESAIYTHGSGAAGDRKLSASLDRVKGAQHGVEVAASKETAAREALKRAEEVANKFESEILADPRKFEKLAQENPWVDRDGNAHEWTLGAYLTTQHVDMKERMNDALMRGLGVETQKADTATPATIQTPDQLHDKGIEQVRAQARQDTVAATAQGRTNAATVKGEQVRHGVEPGAAADKDRKEADSLHHRVGGGQLKIQGDIANAGQALGQQRERFEAGVREGNARSAFEAFQAGVAENPALAAALAASPALTSLSGALGDFVMGDKPGGKGGAGKAARTAAEAASHVDDAADIVRLEKALQAARGVRNVTAVAAAGSGAGLPLAAAEMVVTEGLFFLAESVLSAKKAEMVEATPSQVPANSGMLVERQLVGDRSPDDIPSLGDGAEGGVKTDKATQK